VWYRGPLNNLREVQQPVFFIRVSPS
jgi:hypothetical protein